MDKLSLLLFLFSSTLLVAPSWTARAGSSIRTSSRVTSYSMEPEFSRAYYSNSKHQNNEMPAYTETGSGTGSGHSSNDALSSKGTCSAHNKPQCLAHYGNLENCVACSMKHRDSVRYEKCSKYFQESMANVTLNGMNDPAIVMCCHVSRFIKCAMPLVFRTCDHCAMQQFVKKYRPHLELCHLLTNIQCPISDGRFLDEIRFE